MIDTSAIKTAVNLLDLAGRYVALRRVASTEGGEYHGPCPKCGGADRFRVQPAGGPDRLGWAACRQCWPAGGDLIGFVMWAEGCDFRAACDLLGGPGRGAPASTQPRRPAQPAKAPTAPPGDDWQTAARKFADGCALALWATAGPNAEAAARARQWLAGRGLNDDTLRAWKIGYHAAETWEDRKAWGLPVETNAETGKTPRAFKIPRGIVIPCETGGRLWYLKIRRVPGDSFTCGNWRGKCQHTMTAPGLCPQCQWDNPKYPQVTGSRPALYLAEALRNQRAAVLTEGELDALLLWQAAGDLAGVATLGSAGKDLDLTAWAAYLLPLSPLILAYDADAAGSKGADKLAGLTARAKRAKVPTLREGDKDLTDYHKAGGDLRAWLAFELARHGVKPAQAAGTPRPAQASAVTQPAAAGPDRRPAAPASTPSPAPESAGSPPAPEDYPGLWAAIIANTPAEYEEDDGADLGPDLPGPDPAGIASTAGAPGLIGGAGEDPANLPAQPADSMPAPQAQPAAVMLSDLLAAYDYPTGRPAWPCWACGADAWAERPASGGYFCAVCHPADLPALAEALPA